MSTRHLREVGEFLCVVDCHAEGCRHPFTYLDRQIIERRDGTVERHEAPPEPFRPRLPWEYPEMWS